MATKKRKAKLTKHLWKVRVRQSSREIPSPYCETMLIVVEQTPGSFPDIVAANAKAERVLLKRVRAEHLINPVIECLDYMGTIDE